jgi:hypothetical protein
MQNLFSVEAGAKLQQPHTRGILIYLPQEPVDSVEQRVVPSKTETKQKLVGGFALLSTLLVHRVFNHVHVDPVIDDDPLPRSKPMSCTSSICENS